VGGQGQEAQRRGEVKYQGRKEQPGREQTGAEEGISTPLTNAYVKCPNHIVCATRPTNQLPPYPTQRADRAAAAAGWTGGS
jgi:hypothetical protein